MLKTENISKVYDGKTVLDALSIEIPKGRITSFIGANGAGKSTLLAIISRLLEKSAGRVLLEGRDIRQISNSELSQKLSILNQANQINIRLTVRELVAFGRFPYSKGRLTPEDEKQIDAALAYMELNDMQYRFLDQLSGGQRQRAFIAMIIAQDTEYILLDEPLNNLDMKHSVQIMKILRRLTDELGKTVVVVIHDINFASCYSDYIAALKDGRLLRFGPAREIIENNCLREIFDMDFDIQNIQGHKFCAYFV